MVIFLLLFYLQIETQKLDFKEKAQSKVGSKDNIEHKAGGGDKKVTHLLISNNVNGEDRFGYLNLE